MVKDNRYRLYRPDIRGFYLILYLDAIMLRKCSELYWLFTIFETLNLYGL